MSDNASFDNPFRPKPRGSLVVAIARIREWTRAAFQVPERDPVSITELACAEPGCPPRETVIVIMRADQPAVTLRIHKAMSDIVQADVEGLRS